MINDLLISLALFDRMLLAPPVDARPGPKPVRRRRQFRRDATLVRRRTIVSTTR